MNRNIRCEWIISLVRCSMEYAIICRQLLGSINVTRRQAHLSLDEVLVEGCPTKLRSSGALGIRLLTVNAKLAALGALL